MHTEDEARTKWCPFARYPRQERLARKRQQEDEQRFVPKLGVAPEPCRCIASDCMAWRRGKDAWLTSGGKVIQADREPECGYGHWVKQGYCGLAGKDGA